MIRDSKLREFLGVQQWNVMQVPTTLNGKSPGMLRDIMNRIESLERHLNIKYVEGPDPYEYPRHEEHRDGHED